ncbi:phosphotriesterase-related protein [Mycetocola sp. CAN_C7]|uniref:phosphotriesterase family protein n=1 Tax=Mycetocola sp. CAN_C7 TaxID=2787724 RepID=UPI0018C96C43
MTSPGGFVRTVLGDVPAGDLGRVNYHEHLFQVSPLLPGDELTDEPASQTEAAALHASGFDTMVDATPVGLGRNPEALARISRVAGLTIVATTGAHRDAHYAGDAWLREFSEEELAALFTGDLTTGMPLADGEVQPALGPGTGPVRAGVLKAGIDYWSISPFENTVLRAVASAHRTTGAPVMVHLEFGTAAHEVLDLLEGLGVPPARVALAHADRNPDAGLHLELAARGALLGYDGMARSRTRTDAELLDLTAEVVAGGGTLLLGGDVARRSRYVAYGGMPGLAYLGERYLPRLAERIGADALDGILTVNPHRWLSWDAR